MSPFPPAGPVQPFMPPMTPKSSPGPAGLPPGFNNAPPAKAPKAKFPGKAPAKAPGKPSKVMPRPPMPAPRRGSMRGC